MNKETLLKINQTSSPFWKKILWWTLASFAFLGILGLSVFILMRKKNPIKEIKDTVEQITNKIKWADAEAKAKVAESMGVEKEVVKEIKRISMLDDELERVKRLAELAKEDY